MINIGTDICSIIRIRSAYARFGEKFLERILTPCEKAYVASHTQLLAERLAGRFAVKEAVSKVLKTGWKGVSWREIEVVKESSGAPALNLTGRAKVLSESLGLTHWEVSLSHDGDYALAFVVAHD